MTQATWAVPGYVEIQELGAGAQGRVVLAQQQVTEQRVAIKYLAAAQLMDSAACETFRREAELLSRATSPHVTRLLDYVESPNGAALVMEAVVGRSLREVLDQHEGPLAPETALAVLKGSLQGLAAAHAVGVIHRDYKPANVLVQGDGQSKLIDFGVAVLSGQGGMMGTPAYMAPEQWEGSPCTAATDVYAATCVFYECVTGERPYGAGTLSDLRARHMMVPVPLDDLPEPLRPLVQLGMAKSPGQRTWDITAFIEQIESVAIATYGSDWERRGTAALGAVAAVLVASLPVTAGGLGSAAVGSSAFVASTGSGQAIVGESFLAKMGGAKFLSGAGATLATAAVVAVVIWPETPNVGGSSSGGYRAFFTRPGIVLSNASIPSGATDASPFIAERVSVSPSQVKENTKVRVRVSYTWRTPWGLQYLGPRNYRCHSPNNESRPTPYHHSYSIRIGTNERTDKPHKKERLWLYRTTDGSIGGFDTSNPIRIDVITVSAKSSKDGYDRRRCAWTFSGDAVYEFQIPSSAVVKPGRYVVTRYHPIDHLGAKGEEDGRLVSMSPQSTGGQVQGILPALRVLEP